MSTQVADIPHTQEVASEAEYELYRSLSKAAVVSLILALLSITVVLFPPLLILPLAGMLMGFTALANIRRFPKELTGEGLAKAGIAMSAMFFFMGGAGHTYVYLTEVPDGYQRVTWPVLQPTKERPDLPVSPEALELDGKQVFIKGYVHPAVEGMGPIRKFVLVPDMGTCCFGGQPKLTDMIEVTLMNDTIRYNTQRQKLGGSLNVDTRKKPVSGLDGVYYTLQADYLN